MSRQMRVGGGPGRDESAAAATTTYTTSKTHQNHYHHFTFRHTPKSPTTAYQDPVQRQRSRPKHKNTNTRKNVNMQRRKGQSVVLAVLTSRRGVMIHVSIKGNVCGVLQTIIHFTSILAPSKRTRLLLLFPLPLPFPPSLPQHTCPPTPACTPSPGSTAGEGVLAPCYWVSISAGRWWAEGAFQEAIHSASFLTPFPPLRLFFFLFLRLFILYLLLFSARASNPYVSFLMFFHLRDILRLYRTLKPLSTFSFTLTRTQMQRETNGIEREKE